MTAKLPDSVSQSSQKSDTTMDTRIRNFLIALVAIALGIALYFGLQTQTDTASLEKQAEASTPLEVAMNNHKPTFMEFYANWCTTCQAMASDLAQLKEQYADSVNFVMLNVDNNKWLPEVVKYRVDGIPHFIFFSSEGKTIAQTIGEQPRSILAANLEALATNLPLPYTQGNGQVSPLNSSISVTTGAQDNPRSHGAQVKL